MSVERLDEWLGGKTPEISVVIPWRDAQDRRPIFEWVVQHWITRCSKWDGEILIADSEHIPFHRAASRNEGFYESRGRIIYFVDADVYLLYLGVGPFHAPLDRGNSPRRWLLPSYYIALTEQATHVVRRMDAWPPVNVPKFWTWYHEPSWAGIQVVERSLVEEVRGWDERYIGWGAEDLDFVASLATCTGQKFDRLNLNAPYRREGSAVHLWHQTGEWDTGDHAGKEMNAILHSQYVATLGDWEAMKELKQGSGFCAGS